MMTYHSKEKMIKDFQMFLNEYSESVLSLDDFEEENQIKEIIKTQQGVLLDWQVKMEQKNPYKETESEKWHEKHQSIINSNTYKQITEMYNESHFIYNTIERLFRLKNNKNKEIIELRAKLAEILNETQ